MLMGYKTYIVSAILVLEGLIAVGQGLMADPMVLSMMDINIILSGLGLGALRAGADNAAKKAVQ